VRLHVGRRASSKPNSPAAAGDFRGLDIDSQDEEMVLRRGGQIVVAAAIMAASVAVAVAAVTALKRTVALPQNLTRRQRPAIFVGWA
jgi:hypothetical protein